MHINHKDFFEIPPHCKYYHFLFTVTYFVTYGTAIACYAYFVLTRQDYLLPDVRDRQYLLNFHKRARKSEWDISKYNSLKEGICRAEVELSKLKDHTKLRFLEINRLEILTKVKKSHKNKIVIEWLLKKIQLLKLPFRIVPLHKNQSKFQNTS